MLVGLLVVIVTVVDAVSATPLIVALVNEPQELREKKARRAITIERRTLQEICAHLGSLVR